MNEETSIDIMPDTLCLLWEHTEYKYNVLQLQVMLTKAECLLKYWIILTFDLSLGAVEQICTCFVSASQHKSYAVWHEAAWE
jgi:hypothetical protein